MNHIGKNLSAIPLQDLKVGMHVQHTNIGVKGKINFIDYEFNDSRDEERKLGRIGLIQIIWSNGMNYTDYHGSRDYAGFNDIVLIEENSLNFILKGKPLKPFSVEAIIEAAINLDRENLDNVEVIHPCDDNNDCVRRERLCGPARVLSDLLISLLLTKPREQ